MTLPPNFLNTVSYQSLQYSLVHWLGQWCHVLGDPSPVHRRGRHVQDISCKLPFRSNQYQLGTLQICSIPINASVKHHNMWGSRVLITACLEHHRYVRICSTWLNLHVTSADMVTHLLNKVQAKELHVSCAAEAMELWSWTISYVLTKCPTTHTMAYTHQKSSAAPDMHPLCLADT